MCSNILMYSEIEKKSLDIQININAEIKAVLCRIEEMHKEETHSSIKYTRTF